MEIASGVASKTQFNQIVNKGGKKLFKIDIGQFEALCQKFSSLSDKEIKHLNPSDKKDFSSIVSYIKLLYGTKYYKHLHQKIKLYFGDLPYVRPGTVAGYFTSFLSEQEESKELFESGWKSCDKAVFFAEKTKQGYEITTLKPAESDEDLIDCYLFVEQNNLHDFEGFSRKEKEMLKKLGIQTVNLVGCDEEGSSYFNLYDEPQPIYRLKHRKKVETSDISSVGLAIILVLTFLALIIMFFGWRIELKLK